jgi:hypothetical protein
MDQETVRLHAQAHGDAVVANDLGQAGSDLTPEAQKEAPGVMGKLPRPVSTAEVMTVETQGDECIAKIRYSGEGSTVIVESRWTERDGRPMIVSLAVA